MKKNKILIPVFLILAITLASFYPSLKNDFTNWDDNLYVTENKAIRSVSLENIKEISTSFFIAHYQPVTIYSYLLEYHFFKLNPFNYHLTNLILHLLNCLWVFWLIYIISGNIAIAWITAILFGIHPMQVESVAWISERKNVLCAFFFLGSLVAYLYYLKKEQAKKCYFLCLGLFILALLSKSMAITLPLVLLLLDYFYSRKLSWAVFLEKIPYFLLSVLFGLLALLASSSSQAFYIQGSYGLFTKLAGASGDIVFYLSKLIAPLNLSALYPYFEVKNNPFYLYAFVLVLILAIAAVISIRYTKKIILGSGFFLLVIFPALRSLPLDKILPADRYVYLPAIGIFYLFAQSCMWLYARKIKYGYLLKTFLTIMLAAIIIFLGCATWKRCSVWQNGLSLWNDILKKYPDTAAAFSNRGEFFLKQGQYHQALSDFMFAINARPKSPDDPMLKYYYLNLGNALKALGRNPEAIAVFERLIKDSEEYLDSVHFNSLSTEEKKIAASGPAVEEGSYFKFANLKYLLRDRRKVVEANRMAIEAGAYFNLANIKDLLGDKDEALKLYIKTTELAPRFLYARDYLGALYVNLNRKEEAKAELSQAIDIDPAYLPAYIKLAGLYKSLGQQEKLELLYKKAVTNNLDFFDAYYYCGNLSARIQKDKDALACYRKAVELNPGSKESCVGLGNAYLTLGRNKEAVAWFNKALELDSTLAVAHHNLALAYYYAGEYNLAIQHCDKAGQLGYAISPKLLELLKPYRK
ncbi:MAG: tetratricopeptide repeat protein [Candidatus Omnitrophica bacterium]|nr:tetratricopeptide repeat protein [Candidatus Omnitrophota bacterium]